MRKKAFFLAFIVVLVSLSSIYLPLVKINSTFGRREFRVIEVFQHKPKAKKPAFNNLALFKKIKQEIAASLKSQLQGRSFKKKIHFSFKNAKYFLIPLGILGIIFAHILLLFLILFLLLRWLRAFKITSVLIGVFSLFFALSIPVVNFLIRQILSGGIHIPIEKGFTLSLNVAESIKLAIFLGPAGYILIFVPLGGALLINNNKHKKN